MNYLAFDIEAANGYKLSSICSIGIVIADEQFNILSRQNVWINPKTKYNLNGTRKNVGIDLHLDKKLLASSPDFSQVYDKIKALLTNPDYVIVGHAVDADVRMLNATCKRYNLPSLNFNFICSQLLYKLYNGEKEVKALGKIANALGVTFEEHNSEEDAYMSMMTLKYLVENSGLSVSQLLQKYHVRVGSNVDFELTRSVSLDGQFSKKHLTQIAVEKIKAYAKTVKKTSNVYKDKVFCIARSLEVGDTPELYEVVRNVIAGGGRYSSKLVKCNVYVKSDNPTDQDIMREKRVDELVAQNLVQVISISQILQK